MSATREEIMTALLAKIGVGYVTKTRRVADPTKFQPAQTPALALLEIREEYERKAPQAPPIRRLKAAAVIYVNQAPDAPAGTYPASTVNGLLDALDAALAPDNPVIGRCTLGGLVYHVMIAGEIERSAGDLAGRAIAYAPIEILIP